MVAVNIMAVTQLYETYVKTACAAGVDAIISGAGLPTELPKFAEGYDVALAPIVSSTKSANVILKFWDKKYHRTADFLVIEGPLAGGHLGFSREQLEDIPGLDYDTEIRNIITLKQAYEEKYQTAIPVFVAGGMFTAEDVKHVLELGADGIQAATRFVATEECDASDAYKQATSMLPKKMLSLSKARWECPAALSKMRLSSVCLQHRTKSPTASTV